MVFHIYGSYIGSKWSCIPKKCPIERTWNKIGIQSQGLPLDYFSNLYFFHNPSPAPPPEKKKKKLMVYRCIPTASWPKYVKRSAPSLRGVAEAFCWLCGMFTIQNPTHFWLAVNWTQAIEILFQSMAMFLNVSCFSILLPKCEGNILPLGYFYDMSNLQFT